MKFIRENKKTFIAIAIFLVIVILLIPVKIIFFGSKGNVIYGNRLEGIEKVRINNTTFDKLKTTLKESGVEDVTSRTSGRTVEIIIKVSDDTGLDAAKNYGNKALEAFSKDQLDYYDYQIFVKKGNEEIKDFPIIGYKHHTKDSLRWTKDRTGSAE